MDLTLQGISTGPIDIRFYALMLMAGVAAGVLLARLQARRRGLNPDLTWDFLLWGFAAGLIGARLYHVLDARNIALYLDHPTLIPAVWRGGLGIFGAVLGAMLAVAIYARVKRQPVLTWFDAGMPALLLGQAIGRWGNYFNQELFGRPSDLPWAIGIPPHRVLAEAPEYLEYTHFHPLFLYESILSLIGVGVLLFIARHYRDWLRPGDVALLYFIWYPATRFSVEFLRADRWELRALSVAQIISLALVAVAVAILVWRRRAPTPPTAGGWAFNGELHRQPLGHAQGQR